MAKRRKNAPVRKAEIAAVVDQVVAALAGFGVYVCNVAATGSSYLKFQRRGIGSIRVGDHAGREKYHYRYNVRLDHRGEPMRTTSSGWEQFFYSPKHINQLVAQVQARSDMLDRQERADVPPDNFDQSVPLWGEPIQEANHG